MHRFSSVVVGVLLALLIASLSVPLSAAAQDDGTPRPQVEPTPTFVPCEIPPSVSPSPDATPGDTPPDPTVSPDPTPSPSPTCTPPSPLPDEDPGPRPYGLQGLKDMFGKRCNSKANDARTFMPHAWGRGDGGYVYYHSKLLHKVSVEVADALLYEGKRNAFDYGIWGYACRLKTGGTSWSVHSWGAAIDTNTLRNPYGQTWWDGRGAWGKRYGRLIPNAYMSEDFYWGLNFNDPMHMQYVSGY